jgi:antitoxin HicB
MTPLSYPVVIEEAAPGDFVATFPDIPQAITGAGTPERALQMAEDALATAVGHYLDIGRNVPAPSPGHDLPYVALAPAIAARVLLTWAMAEQGLSKVALAARMQVDEKAVRVILSGRNVSLNRTLDALRAVGVRPALAV